MWLCTLRGFFSVVRKGTPPNNFQVRGRRRKDIENLCDIIGIPLSRIVTSHDSDYEFRVKLNQAELGAMFDGLAATITYGNFKSTVDLQPDQKSADYRPADQQRQHYDGARIVPGLGILALRG